MTRNWTRRDRDAEEVRIKEAAERLLSEITEDSQPPTARDLARAVGMHPNYVYEHKEVVREFTLEVTRRTGKSIQLLKLEKELREEREKTHSLSAQLAQQKEQIRILRLLLAETTLELDDTKARARKQTVSAERAPLASVPPHD